MSPTFVSGGYMILVTGGEHISRHVETRQSKNFFLKRIGKFYPLFLKLELSVNEFQEELPYKVL